VRKMLYGLLKRIAAPKEDPATETTPS
jgi:hypothetical protein